MNILRQSLAIMLTVTVLVAALPIAKAQSNPPLPNQQPQQANLSPSEIDAIVSPIALYPDQLVAQILAAATYPDQVVAASQWVKSNQTMPTDVLMQAADKQPWDPSVKALTQFPSVLDQMVNNMAWTLALGDIAYNQQGEAMAAIQRLRLEAKAAGNLKSNQQIQIIQQDPQTIVIQPANPQVVYVPQYNPAAVYGTPYYPPGYSTGAMVATGLISFGAGVAVAAAFGPGPCCGWAWGSGAWGANWHGRTVVYNRHAYVSRSNAFYGQNRYNYRKNYFGGRPPAAFNGKNPRPLGGNWNTGNINKPAMPMPKPSVPMPKPAMPNPAAGARPGGNPAANVKPGRPGMGVPANQGSAARTAQPPRTFGRAAPQGSAARPAEPSRGDRRRR